MDINYSHLAKEISALSELVNEKRIELIHKVLSERTRHLTLVLDDIYQPQNASATLRTSECFGIQDVHIISIENSFSPNRDVVRGANQWLTLHRHASRKDCIESLKANHYKIGVLTLRNDAKDLNTISPKDRLALCIGNEEHGVSEELHQAADHLIKIPMCGFTQSFNLSVSAALSFYELTDKMKADPEISWQLTNEEKMVLERDWLIHSIKSGRRIYEKIRKEISASQK